MSSAPPGFPSNIPVKQEKFENWSQGIKVKDLWTCVPQSEADVVTVCNWAAGAGYQVRPRGIMHNWSPLTVQEGQSPAKVLLVDTTQKLNVISVTPATAALFDRMGVATVDDLIRHYPYRYDDLREVTAVADLRRIVLDQGGEQNVCGIIRQFKHVRLRGRVRSKTSAAQGGSSWSSSARPRVC